MIAPALAPMIDAAAAGWQAAQPYLLVGGTFVGVVFSVAQGVEAITSLRDRVRAGRAARMAAAAQRQRAMEAAQVAAANARDAARRAAQAVAEQEARDARAEADALERLRYPYGRGRGEASPPGAPLAVQTAFDSVSALAAEARAGAAHGREGEFLVYWNSLCAKHPQWHRKWLAHFAQLGQPREEWMASQRLSGWISWGARQAVADRADLTPGERAFLASPDPVVFFSPRDDGTEWRVRHHVLQYAVGRGVVPDPDAAPRAAVMFAGLLELQRRGVYPAGQPMAVEWCTKGDREITTFVHQCLHTREAVPADLSFALTAAERDAISRADKTRGGMWDRAARDGRLAPSLPPLPPLSVPSRATPGVPTPPAPPTAGVTTPVRECDERPTRHRVVEVDPELGERRPPAAAAMLAE